MGWATRAIAGAGRRDEAKCKLVVALLPKDAEEVEASGGPSPAIPAWDESWRPGKFDDRTMVHFGVRQR